MTEYRALRGELARQADIARALGSPFVGAVLDAAERNISNAPRTAALIDTWPGDPSAAALAMRFNAAMHALARRGRPRALQSLYQRQHGDFDEAIRTALAAEDAFIADWMRDPPQTNEVGRAAAIMSALIMAERSFGLPFELLELGSSAGLNLNLAHYSYDLGGLAAGDHDSLVKVAPEWNGPPPPQAKVEVVSARGVDLHPLDVSCEDTRERLLSFVFADQPQRAERLRQALALARRYPPWIDRADAVSWLRTRLAVPQQAGRCRVVFHSMVLQYFGAEGRTAARELVAEAGSRATQERPFAWISFEWTPDRREVQLQLTTWPHGETRVLATCHPYGASIDWRG